MITTVKLQFPETFRSNQPLAQCLRGAICSLDPSNPLLCQKENGKFLFRYARIHYRWQAPRTGVIVGFLDGARYLLNLPLAGKTLTLGDEQVPVIGSQIVTSPLEFSEADTLRRYRLRSPWLPFSHKSYSRFNRGSRDSQQADLDRLARNHLVSAMRDLEHPPTWRVQAAFEVSQMRFVKYKDIQALGVWGTLVCNVNLPSGFALGRKPSYGYGSLF